MRLQNLPPSQRQEIAQLIARGYLVTEARLEFYRLHPEYLPDDWYPYQTVLSYVRSDEGVREIEEEKKKLRDNAATGDYVHRGERLSVLVENLRNLMSEFRAGPDVRTKIALSSECRQIIREIREEAVPYDTEGRGIQSPFQDFVDLLKQVPEEMRTLMTEKAN